MDDRERSGTVRFHRSYVNARGRNCGIVPALNGAKLTDPGIPAQAGKQGQASVSDNCRQFEAASG